MHCNLCLFAFGLLFISTGTLGNFRFFPFGSPAIAEVPLARSPAQNVKSLRPYPCMKNNINPQANERQEVLLRFLDASDSDTEHDPRSRVTKQLTLFDEVKP